MEVFRHALFESLRGTHGQILISIIKFTDNYSPFAEIRDGVFVSRDRTGDEKSTALRRLLGATYSLAAANVAGLPGCAYLQSLGTENEERWRRPRFVRVGAEGNDLEWFSRIRSNT